MAQLEIVTIGTEILLGDLVDTNAAHIARTLADHGLDVFAKHSVGDNAVRLEMMLRGALERADGVITTGGLGPTVDDLTKEAVAAVLEQPLEEHAESLDAIAARLALFGRTMTANNARQALIPRGSVVLPNPHGTAPGFIALRRDGKFIACMPGVPSEMKAMLAERLLPWFGQRFGVHGAIYTRTLHTIGVAEAELDERIERLFRTLENPKIAMLAHSGRVDVKLMAKARDRAEADALFAPVEAQLRGLIEHGIYGVDDETLESAIVERLTRAKLTIATAESVSGGAIADALVRAAGASQCFRGGFIAYANDVKTDVLGVDGALLARHGAVSEEVAVAMAARAGAVLRTDLAIATTGVAGPSGGSAEKPVGLVWLALASAGETLATRRAVFPGNRADIRWRTVLAALAMIWLHLEASRPSR